MYQTKFSAQEILQARKEVAQDYGRSLAMYAPPPSEEEIAEAIKTLHQLNVEAAYANFKQVVAKNQKKSPSCGCTGKNASAGKYETKSMSAVSTRQTKSSGLFASAYEQVQADAAFEAFEAFCSKFPYMCNER